ncbi:MAG: hypothetical protein LUE86_02920 [Clostridiales bacterium]|nr:hypothetical protein [Clostridiales bacterium]
MQRIISLINYIITGTTMGYTTLVFFCCVLIFLGILFLLRSQRAKILWILIANLVFYVWSVGIAALVIVLGTAVIVYLVTRKMGSIYEGFESETIGMTPKERTVILVKYKKRAKKYLLSGMFLLLVIWIYVKVGKLLAFDSVDTFRDWIRGKGIIVPLGISYYSLSAIGYMLDVFWRKTKPERNFISLFSAMTYFPHIVQGPISKYSRLLKQMNAIPSFDFDRVCFGLQLMLWGYIKKLVIADRLVVFTNCVFDSPTDFAGVEILLAVVLCAFQLYADFSGCMDIVGGISQAVGIELPVNFRQPFFSRNVAEFWRRWHMTLGDWTKEYIYLPIATNPRFMKWIWNMNKSGKVWLSAFLKTLIPSFIVWLFTGLWHGNGKGYLVWGLYWCALITVSTELKPWTDRLTKALWIDTGALYFRIWQSVRVVLCFAIGRMFTVTGWLRGCLMLWKQLFAEHRLWVLFDGSLYNYGLDSKDFGVALLGILVLMLVDARHEKGMKIRESLAKQPLPLRWVVYYAAMFAIVILGMYGPGYNAASFVYGAF